jgi:hypothetical protein
MPERVQSGSHWSYSAWTLTLVHAQSRSMTRCPVTGHLVPRRFDLGPHGTAREGRALELGRGGTSEASRRGCSPVCIDAVHVGEQQQTVRLERSSQEHRGPDGGLDIAPLRRSARGLSALEQGVATEGDDHQHPVSFHAVGLSR